MINLQGYEEDEETIEYEVTGFLSINHFSVLQYFVFLQRFAFNTLAHHSFLPHLHLLFPECLYDGHLFCLNLKKDSKIFIQ